MTLQASGAIKFSELRAEFGGAAPDTLDEYYRGGGLVPDTPANAGIPISGAISLSDFYSGSAFIVTVNGHALIGDNGVGSPCSAGVRVKRNGQYHVGSHNLSTSPTYADAGGGEWASDESASVGDDYECRLVTVSGTLSVGTADTFLAMTSDRSFEVNSTGLKVFTGTMEIWNAGHTTLLDSASVSLTADGLP